MQRKFLTWFLLSQIVFVLGGCGGGSDSTPPSQPSVSSVKVLTGGTIEPRSTVDVSVTLSSDAGSWTTREEHATGSYEARYERTSDGAIRKSKLHYLALPAPMSVDVLSSDTLARLSPTLWIESAEGRESLAAVQKADHPERPSSGARTLVAISGSGTQGTATSDATRVSGDADEVAKRFSASLDRFDRHNRETFDDLIAQLREHPELASAVAARILAPGTDDSIQAALMDVLGTSGTPAAQLALLAIAVNPDASHMNAIRAIIARDGLWSIARKEGDPNVADLSRTALLALGAVASTLRTNGDPAASSVTTDLLSAIPEKEGPDLRVALKALGNTGDPAAAERIRSYMASESAATRAAAATTLRRMPDARTGELLLSSLASEKVPEVRGAVVRSIASSGIDDAAIAAIAENAQTEKNDLVRGEMIRALAKGVDSSPVARNSLERMLDTEKDPQNIELLRRALSRVPKTP